MDKQRGTNMPDLTIRNISAETHAWLRQQAQRHRRSVDREAIALLEEIRVAAMNQPRRLSVEQIMSRGKHFAALPMHDLRNVEDIVDYDENGTTFMLAKR